MSKSNKEAIEVRLGEKEGFVLSVEGEPMEIPSDWAHLLPGDAALSRRVKMEGPSWTVVEYKRRKKILARNFGSGGPNRAVERRARKGEKGT